MRSESVLPSAGSTLSSPSLFSSAFTCPGCGESSRMRLPMRTASGIESFYEAFVGRM